MKKITFLLLSILLIAGTVLADNSVKNIVMISSKEFSNEHNSVFIRELNSYLKDENYNLSKFYLNCDGGCPEDLMKRKFRNALTRASLMDVNHLIITGELLWTEFHQYILNFKKLYPEVKVGLFNIFEHDSEFQLYFEDNFKDAHIFVNFSRISLDTFMFYTRKNGMEFNNFYILRDGSNISLQKANFLKDALRMYGKLKVDVHLISSLQDLRVTVLRLQDKEQGILIPLLEQISDSNDHVKMISIINKHNRTHFELGILNNGSEHLSFTLSHIINTETDNYKKSPHLDLQTNIRRFFLEFDGTKNLYAEETIYFILNEKRVRQIYGGFKLLKFKNDFVDCLR